MAERAPDAPRHRGLIVDDEEATRLLLAHILTRDLDLEVQLAGTCEQALRLAGNYAYDTILLDLMMPGIGGLEVLKDLRRASPNTTTPVIIVSVLAESATMQACLEAGASAYLVKPADRATLAATVRAQIASRRGPGRHDA